MAKEKTKRNEELYLLKESGASFGRLSIKYGICRERARRIYLNELEKRECIQMTHEFLNALTDVCPYRWLVTRIFRCLSRAGIIRFMDETGYTLDFYQDETLLSIPMLGKKSLRYCREANKLYKARLQGSNKE